MSLMSLCRFEEKLVEDVGIQGYFPKMRVAGTHLYTDGDNPVGRKKLNTREAEGITQDEGTST